MTDQEQKHIFSKNLSRLLSESGKSQKEVAKAVGVQASTFNTWVKGISIPRMGKVQALADYFSVSKTDLIDELTVEDIQQRLIDKYINDPKIKELVLLAGGLEPTEMRDKYVDALITSLLAMYNAGRSIQ